MLRLYVRSLKLCNVLVMLLHILTCICLGQTIIFGTCRHRIENHSAPFAIFEVVIKLKEYWKFSSSIASVYNHQKQWMGCMFWLLHWSESSSRFSSKTYSLKLHKYLLICSFFIIYFFAKFLNPIFSSPADSEGNNQAGIPGGCRKKSIYRLAIIIFDKSMSWSVWNWLFLYLSWCSNYISILIIFGF